MMMKWPRPSAGGEQSPSAGPPPWSGAVVIASWWPQILAEYYPIKQYERKSKYMFTGY